MDEIDNAPNNAPINANDASFRCSLASVNHHELCVPPNSTNVNLIEQRKSLPIFRYRQHIIDTINCNQVIVVSGDTGSGKTTQVPQYILEDHWQRRRPCRIICTQPRRLAAISISDRVANERGEQLGQAIGYQVRLESRSSHNSNLIYTTSGFLLRCLISGTKQELFSSLTHIIMDEVHERDKFSDFLLIAIKEALDNYPNLKVILMSATIDSNVFTEYFYGCPIVDIPGRMFPVEIYNLEDVLGLIGFTNPAIEDYRKNMSTFPISTFEPECK